MAIEYIDDTDSKKKTAEKQSYNLKGGILENIDNFITSPAKYTKERVKNIYDNPKENAREYAATIADVAPFVLAPEVKGGLLAKMGLEAGINAASTGTADLIRGKSIGSSAKDAFYSGLTAGATAAAMKPLGHIGSKLKTPISEGISSVGSFLSSVPKELYKRAVDKALDGASIFKNNAEQDEALLKILYERMRKGVNFVKKEAGKQVMAEKEAIKNMGQKVPKFDNKKALSFIDDLVENAKASGGESAYTSEGLNAIEKIRGRFSGEDIPIDDANLIKNKINAGVYSRRGTSPIIDPAGPDEAALQAIGSEIKKQVAQKAPILNQVNKDFSQKRALASKISSKLSDFRQGPRTFKGAVSKKNDELGRILEEVDELLPPELKSVDELKDIIARDKFRKFTPGQGGGSGTSEGAANLERTAVLNGLLRAGSVAGVGKVEGILPALALAASFSPVVHKAGIKGLGLGVKAGRSAAPLLPSVAAKLAPKSQEDNSTDPAWLETIKRQRGIK